MHLTRLMPQLRGFRITNVRLTLEDVVLAATAIRTTAPCPLCHRRSHCVHSTYTRTVADLPWQLRRVTITLCVRRFFCRNSACPRRIFCERLPVLVAVQQRRTVASRTALQQIGLALGGRAGVRLATPLGMPTSRMTLLRRVRALPLPTYAPPIAVGIDDWAWRKGHTYGTLVVDLERHCAIALLPKREMETVAQWLRAHPDIAVIARDRAEAYAEAATRGAPAAQQVADRWHVLRNLGDTVAQVFERYTRYLRSHRPMFLPTVPHTQLVSDETVVVGPSTPSPRAAELAGQRRAHRVTRYEQVSQLHAQGWPCRAIARELGINRATVTKLVQAAQFPERQPASRRRPSLLDPHIPYILDRWNAGCRNGTQIVRELVQRGYRGKRSIALSYMTRLRQALGIPAKKRTITMGRVIDLKPRPLTPRAAAWLVLRRPDTLDATDQQRVATLRAAHPDINAVITLAHAFTTMVRTQQVDALDPWLAQAAASPVRAFRAFATSLRKDYAAVRAGMTLPWSTGPVEGHINRVKMIKRQMFGRAGLDLLAIRVLHAP